MPRLDLPREVWWIVLDSLNVCQLLMCTMVSHTMKHHVLTFKPDKALDMSILPPSNRQRLPNTKPTPTLKQIILNHRGLDMSRTLINPTLLEILLKLNLAWISVERCVNLTGRAAINTYCRFIHNRAHITTDLYILDAGIPTRIGSTYSLMKCSERARVYIHACRGNYIDVTTINQGRNYDDETVLCHQCGARTNMYGACSRCCLPTCNQCKTSKCNQCDPDSHGRFCTGCLQDNVCTLCESFDCVWDKSETSAKKVLTCTICGIRSCNACTPSMYQCQCWNSYCGQCFVSCWKEKCKRTFPH